MSYPIHMLFLIIAALLVLSVVISKLSVRIGVPVLLVFILIGMGIGSEGLGGITFDDPELTQSVGVVALVFILFAGGLDTQWQTVRMAIKEGVLLSTIGVGITALAVAWLAVTFMGFTWLTGILLGATMAATDAAAVFSVLRGKGVELKGKLKPILELESGSNDPMAVFLTLGMIQWISTPDTQITDLLGMFIVQMSLGLLIGVLIGYLMIYALNQLRLEYDGLYPVLTIGCVLLCYGFTTAVGGNGFLAIYVTGLLLGRGDFIHKASLTQFHDGLAWLMQIAMFLVLGLLVFPSNLVPVAGSSLLVAAFLIIIARPAAVLLLLLPSKISFRGKLLTAWIGLRGAVPIILATFPLLAGVEGADTLFNIVFFVVLTSVLIQGPLIPYVTKWLNLQTPGVINPYPTRVFLPEVSTDSRVIELNVLPESGLAGTAVMDLRLPAGALIVLVNRGNIPIVPSGATTLEIGDELLILADPASLAELQARFDAAFAKAQEASSQPAT